MQAEALLGVGNTAPGIGGAEDWAWDQQAQQPAAEWRYQGPEYQQQQRQQQWGGGPASSLEGALGSSDTAATEAGAAAPHRPPSAFSLGETALALRLTVHEKQMELLQLRAQYAALTVRAAELARLPRICLSLAVTGWQVPPTCLPACHAPPSLRLLPTLLMPYPSCPAGAEPASGAAG